MNHPPNRPRPPFREYGVPSHPGTTPYSAGEPTANINTGYGMPPMGMPGMGMQPGMGMPGGPGMGMGSPGMMPGAPGMGMGSPGMMPGAPGMGMGMPGMPPGAPGMMPPSYVQQDDFDESPGYRMPPMHPGMMPGNGQAPPPPSWVNSPPPGPMTPYGMPSNPYDPATLKATYSQMKERHRQEEQALKWAMNRAGIRSELSDDSASTQADDSSVMRDDSSSAM